MKERNMHKPFEKWLSSRTDTFTDELDTGAGSPRFDYISIEKDKVVIYELKVKNAEDVILQANHAMLWSDHAYVVMPEKHIHLAIKRNQMFCDWVGLLSLNMETGNIHEFIKPQKDCYMASKRMKQAMRREIILYNIADHCTPRRYPKRGY